MHTCQTSQPGNRPGREKPTARSMHIQFFKKLKMHDYLASYRCNTAVSAAHYFSYAMV